MDKLRRFDWGHIVLAIVLTGFCIWYLNATYTASAAMMNLVLIAPAALLAIVLGISILVWEIRRALVGQPNSYDPALRPIIIVALLFAYIPACSVIGLDFATPIFLFATIMSLGEKNWVRAALYSIIYSVLLLAMMRWMAYIPPSPLMSGGF